MLCSWTSPSTARGSPGKRYRKANEILNKRQIDWLNEDCIKSYDGMVAGINFRLKTNYPDMYIIMIPTLYCFNSKTVMMLSVIQ